MKPAGTALAPRRRLLLAGLCLAGALVAGRAFQLQALEAERWAERAEDQQQERLELPAPRGTVYDRKGVPLVAVREAVRVAVAPREVADRIATARLLVQVLGISEARAGRAVDPARRWVVLPGRFEVTTRGRLEGVRGVYVEKVLERFYPHGDLGLEVIGRITGDGRAAGGLELELDSLLSGTAGVAVVRRDARGAAIPGAMLVVREPVPGHDVFLTLDYDLQEIAREALRDAVRETGSSAGELLLADPRTGEILAAATERSAGGAWSAVTEPYEPGSTLKPFMLAALLSDGVASLADSVFAEEGRWIVGSRTISDTRPHGWLTVAQALEVSSNVAFAKLSSRIVPARQYVYLRDFGFGTPSGVPYPSESSGLLRRPREWSRFSQASLAIGYEISVTPVQMVLAYAALANGGVLMEPRLLQEVRARDGRIIRADRPRAVRRVVEPQVAAQVALALTDAVEAGSGRAAGLGPFAVAGKTGTARRFVAGRYEPGSYTASFAGFFPASDPQVVFLVKLDAPRGAYYGGQAAAPVMRGTLAAALASRFSPIDRSAVAEATPSLRGRGSTRRGPAADVGLPLPTLGGDPVTLPGPGPFIFALDARPPVVYRAQAAASVAVPPAAGLPLRDAVRRLHRSGFHVEVEGGGVARGTVPAAGTALAPGSTVTILGAEGE
jgi:cell division protein FtsI (penicillin-binding protein 3)